MTVLDVVLGLFVLFVALEVINLIAWRQTRSDLRRAYGSAPWNWRVLLGPLVYLRWMDKR